LSRKTQRLENAAFFEGAGDLLLPVGAELLHPPVELLTKLAVQISGCFVTRGCSDDRRSKIAKGDLLKLRNGRFRSVEPDRLLDGWGELLGKGEDRLAGDLGPAFGTSPLPLCGDRSTNCRYASGRQAFRDGSLLGRQACKQEIAMGRSRFEAGDRSPRHSLWLARARGRGLPRARKASLAGGRSGTAGGARGPGPSPAARGCRATFSGADGPVSGCSFGSGPPFGASLAARGCRATFSGADGPVSGCSFGSGPPFGASLAAKGCRATFSGARRPASRPAVRTRPPFGSALAGRFEFAGSRLRAPSIRALSSARRAAISRGAAIATAWAVEEIAAVAAPAPF
jgi:hypothetical protein